MPLLRLNLTGYHVMEQPTLPPIPWPRGYVLAHNGLFAWAKREGLEALIPVASCTVAGLYSVEPYVRLDYPPVDAWVISQTFQLSREARTPEGGYKEILLYLERDQTRGWQLNVPLQDQQEGSVRPLLKTDADQLRYANTLFEIHSHHTMPAFFSGRDNADAQGFRLDGVIGRIGGDYHRSPEIRIRVGIYGDFWEIPSSTVLRLPWGVTDCVVRDQMRILGEEYNREKGREDDR